MFMMTKPQQNVEIIAEIGQAHDGSLGILYSYIDALAESGVDTVKFQTHIADAESSEFEAFRVNFSLEDKTRYDYWKRMEFSLEQWRNIKIYTESKGLKFLSSPFSIEAINLLQTIGAERYKVGSGELLNSLLLQKIANTGKPVILSTGLAESADLERALGIFLPIGNDVSILQCTTAYPTAPKDWGLPFLKKMISDYPGYRIGYSDHSGSLFCGASAVSLGAKILEFHVVFDRRMFGPDSKASLEIDEVSQLVKGVRAIEASLNSLTGKSQTIDPKLRDLFGKTISASRSLEAGHRLEFDDLEAKKPAGHGVSAIDYTLVIGRVLKKDISIGEFIKESHFE